MQFNNHCANIAAGQYIMYNYGQRRAIRLEGNLVP